MSDYHTLLDSIAAKKITVGILGMGYVGSAVAEGTSDAGLDTIGFDISPDKVEIVEKRAKNHLHASTDMSRIGECDVICVCVPTPLRTDRTPDLSFIESAVDTITTYMKPGQLVVIESSVAPGTTRNVALPRLMKKGYIVGKDIFLGYSPERIDPGNVKYTVKNIPKIVSGIDENSSVLVQAFYSTFVETVVPVSTPETAEMAKILENLFRLVNISLVNELMAYTHEVGIDLWEVISAAATKPFGFLPHYPSAGAGGYCIPVLPRFLMEDAKKRNVSLPLVEMAYDVNEHRASKVVSKAMKLLNGARDKKKPKVLLVGVAYKEGNTDIRESTAIKVWEAAKNEGADVSYHDPHVPNVNGLRSVDLTPNVLRDQDLIIITTAHKNIAYDRIVASKKPVIDTRNVLKAYHTPNIIRL